MMKKMSTRLTAVLGIMVFFFMLAPMVKVEAKEKTNTWGDYTYRILTEKDNSRYIILDRYNGTEENLVIPEQIDSVEVRYTPASYQHPDQIKKMTLPASVRYVNVSSKLNHLETIGVSEQNRYFKSVDGVLFNKKETKLVWYPTAKKGSAYTIPDQVTELEVGAFTDNQYLEKITIGKKLKRVHSFENSNLQTVVLSDGVEGIEEQAFSGCRKLHTVVMGRNVRWFGREAFMNCVSLKNISLPKNLVRIRLWAFKNCRALNKKLTIPESVYSVDYAAFEGCPARLKMPEYMKWQKDKKRYRASVKVQLLKTGKTKSYSIATMSKLRPKEKTVTVKRGKSKKLQIIGYRMDKKLGIVDSGILKYTSSNPKIARVSKRGNIKAYKKGKVTIKVDFRPQMKGYDNRKKYCYVTIKVK